MIRFDSDYQEGCFPLILQRLQESNFEQTPGYGEDRHCRNAADIIRDLCKAPQAEVHFLVGGTQTNSTVISSQLRPHQGALCASTGHIGVHETGAIEHGGHKVLPLPSDDGKISASQVRLALEEHFSDASREHVVQPGMVYISFPTEKGTIYSLDELEALHEVCGEAGIPLFIDGARLGYGLCSEGCDVTLPDIARCCDIFYIGGTKQGALFGEAVVFCNPSLARDFRYLVKQGGGLLAKGRLLGIQFETMLGEGLYFQAARKAVAQALRLKAALLDKGYPLFADSPSNQQFPILDNATIARLRGTFSFEDWAKVDSGHTAVRFCTSWATTDEAVDRLISSL